MKTTSSRARTLACALLAGTFYSAVAAAPAAAQSAPTFRTLDPNGVDLVKGDFLTSFPEGSIGSGEAELVLLRMVGAIGGNGTLGTSQWDRMIFNITSSGTYVDFGSRVDKFPGAESRGSSLAGSDDSYFYRSADGTVIAFGNPTSGFDANYCDGTTKPSCILLPMSITSPDGKVVTINYEFYTKCIQPPPPSDPEQEPEPPNCSNTPRIASVSNSFGYEIRFSYVSGTTGSTSTPPATFHQRNGASFYNVNASSSPLAAVSYSYPSTGGTDITDTGGRVWRVTSNPANHAIRRPGATSITTSASLSGGIVSSVTHEGVTTNYSRSVSGNIVTMTVTNALSQVSTVISNLTTGRPATVTDPLNRTTAFQYDGDDRLKRVIAPEGNYVEHTYDARGNVIQTVAVPKGGTGPTIVTSASYDTTCSNPVKCNRPNSTTDARGNVTVYEYDPTHGGVTKVTSPAPTTTAVQPETRYGYTLTNGEYRLTDVSQCQTTASCAGTADEVKTVLAYDPNGNLYWTATGNGSATLVAATTMTFDPIGNLLTVDGPLPGTADTGRIRYNTARQVLGTVSPDPDGGGVLKHRAVRNTYDSSTGLLIKVEQGNVTSQSNSDWAGFSPAQSVETSYDANARPVFGKLVSGSTAYALTQTTYDQLGRVECVAQRMDMADFASPFPDACTLTTPAGSEGPDRIVKTFYDTAGRVTEVKTALGTADEASEIRKSYTANGQVEWVMDGEGNKTTYEYDGHDRLVKTYFPMPTPRGAGISNGADYEQLAYESLTGGTHTSPLVVAFRNRANQSIGFSYDALGRQIVKDLPGAEPDVSYGYDLLGRLTSASQTGHALGFTWDALGRNLDQTGPLGTVSSEWDLAGRRTRLSWPDAFFVTYDHLVTGETTAIRENGAASGIGVIGTLAYDDLGRRTSLTLGNGVATHYDYDPVSRLNALKLEFAGSANDLTSSFTYNPAGQIASNIRSNDAYAWTGNGSGTTSTTANGLNQIQSWVTSLVHDAKGNIVTDGSYSYGYSSENLLTSLTNPSGTVQAWSTYAYDPLSRLAIIDSSNPALDVRFGYDGEEMVYEALSGGRTRRYVYGPGIDEPLVGYLVTSAGTSRLWYQSDERGSIARLSNDSGTPGGIGKYDEYGVGGTSRFRYAGHYWLGDANLLYSRARIYDPRLGRFLQPDPIGYGGGMNMYAYVKGDPVNFTDPTGTKGQCFQVPGSRLWRCGSSSQQKADDAGTGGVGGSETGSSKGAGSDPLLGPKINTVETDMGDAIVTGTRYAALQVNPIHDYGRVVEQKWNEIHIRSKSNKRPKGSDMCGATSSEWVPDSVGAIDLKGACSNHDECYTTLGLSKAQCDAKFYLDVNQACATSATNPVMCPMLATSYFIGVTVGGLDSYKEGQRIAQARRHQ